MNDKHVKNIAVTSIAVIAVIFYWTMIILDANSFLRNNFMAVMWAIIFGIIVTKKEDERLKSDFFMLGMSLIIILQQMLLAYR